MTQKAWGALLLVGGIWGASFLFIRVAVEEVSPLQTVLFRTGLGSIVLLAVVVVRRERPRITRRLALSLVLLSLSSTLVPVYLISWAQTRIDSGTAAILNAIMPLFTLGFGVALLQDERLTLRAGAGVVLGIAGVALLSGGGPDVSRASLEAQMAVVAAMACYAAGNIYVRYLVRTLPGVVISAAQISISAVVTLAISLAFEPPKLDLSWEVWGSLLALGFLGTGVAYIAYYWLIEHAGSFRAALVTYIIPVVGVILGALVLDEAVTAATVAGGLTIAAGVAIGTGGLDPVLRGIAGGRPRTSAESDATASIPPAP